MKSAECTYCFGQGAESASVDGDSFTTSPSRCLMCSPSLPHPPKNFSPEESMAAAEDAVRRAFARDEERKHAAANGLATPTFDLPGTSEEMAVDPDLKFRESAVNNNATALLHKLKRVGRTMSQAEFFADLDEMERAERDYEKKYGKKSS